MPFRALIRTVDPDGNFKVGLDELALYFLRSRGWLKKNPQFDANGNRLERVDEHGEETDSDYADGEGRDISYAEMVAASLDEMLMGVIDEVVGLLPRRGGMDLGYSQDAYVHPSMEEVQGEGAGPSSSGSSYLDEEDETEEEEKPRRGLWRQLGMVGAAALGLLTASTRV